MSKEPTPSPDRPDGGKDARGRFAPGNKLGRGSPLAGRAAKIRAELLAALTPADTKAIIKTLVGLARSGDLAAIRELLDRTIGKPSPTDVLERIERLEAAVGADAVDKFFDEGAESNG